MKLLLFGSRAGWLVGAPQTSRSNNGSTESGASGASWAETVVLNVCPKLTASPSNVSGACSWTNSTILEAYAGSLGVGVAPGMLWSGAGKVLPLILVYGIRPAS